MKIIPNITLACALFSLAFAGCIGEESEPDSMEVVPCADDDIQCLCEGAQSCIDDRTDTDGDGLFDSHEMRLGTGVNNTDTDNDGVGDGDEVAAGTPPRIPHYPNDGGFTLEIIDLVSTAPHNIPVSVFKPDAATAETPFPVMLHSHGFTGTKMGASSADLVSEYVAAGFAVISFDERGHGDARDDSVVTFMHPSAEVLDVITILDHIATLDWVLRDLDNPSDPVVGGIGDSYGGAFQLMTGIFDDRIDAMVPGITWNSINEALAPNGAIKSGWVDLFYGAGNAQQSVKFSNDFHAGFAYATAANEMPAGQAPGIPDLDTLFREASPGNYDEGMDVPTLLVQGMPDSLFSLNQAVWNYERLLENEVPAQLYTHLQGHVLPGLQGAAGGTPCGDMTSLNIMWHQRWLLELPETTGPKVCISLEDGTAIVGDEFPLESTSMVSVPIDGMFPMVQAVGGTTIPLYTFTAEEETVVAGIPRLSGSMIAPGPDTIVYFSFQKVTTDGLMEHIVDDQIMPLRLRSQTEAGVGINPNPQSFDMELGGIATKLAAGDQMTLVVSSLEPLYFGNTERLPSGSVLQDLHLILPVVTDPVLKE